MLELCNLFFCYFCVCFCFFFFFFQAEDGIRDLTVTGVQTCALPISRSSAFCSSASRRSARASLDEARSHLTRATSSSGSNGFVRYSSAPSSHPRDRKSVV